MTFGQTYTARSPYYADRRVGAHRLVVAVECQLDGYQFHALLDTAADWCVLSLEVAELLGCELEPDPEVPPYSTRYGRSWAAASGFPSCSSRRQARLWKSTRPSSSRPIGPAPS